MKDKLADLAARLEGGPSGQVVEEVRQALVALAEADGTDEEDEGDEEDEDGDGLEDMTVAQLKDRAEELGVLLSSDARKADIIEALREAELEGEDGKSAADDGDGNAP